MTGQDAVKQTVKRLQDHADALAGADMDARLRTLLSSCRSLHVSLLLDGADPNSPAMHREAFNGDQERLLAAIDAAKASGKSPDGDNPERPSPLAYALLAGNMRAAEALIAAGADPKRLDGKGRSLFFYALDTSLKTARDAIALSTRLAELGVDINLPDRNDVTPLMYAAAHPFEHDGFVVSHACGRLGADMSRTDTNGACAAHYAIASDNAANARVLLTRQKHVGELQSCTPMFVAEKMGENGKRCRILLQSLDMTENRGRNTVAMIPEMAGQLTLGADIEAEFFSMSAGGVFRFRPGETVFKAAAGEEVSENGRVYGFVGFDDERDPGELRPKEAESAASLVRNIRKLIHYAYGTKNLRISVGGNRTAIGAHVHFGLSGNKQLRECFVDGRLAGFVRLLDDFLGKKMLPLSGSTRGIYKKLGAAKEQPHGFEYRSLPAAVFHDPRTLGTVLKLCRSLAKEVAKGDVSYVADEKDGAVRAEYERRIGKTHAARLFKFMEQYVARTRGEAWMVEIDRKAWGAPKGQER